MIENTVDRARRLLTKEAADHLAALFAKIVVCDQHMDDRAFVGLCLTLMSASAVVAAEADDRADDRAVTYGRIYRGGTFYKVQPAD